MKSFIALTLLIASSLLIVGVATTSLAHASPLPRASYVAADSGSDACAGLAQVGGATCGQGQAGINKVANSIVKIISYIAGVLAVIMIIVAGIRYTTSGGDSASVGGAKTALVYALVGVAVASLAQLLIHLVLNNTNV